MITVSLSVMQALCCCTPGIIHYNLYERAHTKVHKSTVMYTVRNMYVIHTLGNGVAFQFLEHTLIIYIYVYALTPMYGKTCAYLLHIYTFIYFQTLCV